MGTLTMLEAQRDAVEYEDMDISAIRDYVKHTAGQNDAYPAGLSHRFDRWGPVPCRFRTWTGL